MNFKNLIITLAFALPMMMAAADYPWLTFLMADNTELSVASDNLEINYSDGNLQLTSATVDQSIPVNQIKSMRFTTLSSAIDEIADDFTSPADYFTLSGVCVGRFATLDEARSSLPAGIYIGKSESKTLKVIF